MKELTIAISGRPNVGKSTLFNRLIGKKQAIVEDSPGVTRDWREGKAKLGELSFKVIDTAGLEEKIKDELSEKIKTTTLQVLNDVDAIFFVVDGKTGITNEDLILVKLYRKLSANLILVVNKCESSNSALFLQDYYRLGLGEPIFISAEHGLGMIDLFDAIHKISDSLGLVESKHEVIESISIAIVGRPNAGKSTLINRILKKERMVTADVPGTTRDAISVDFQFQGNNLKLIDTAGLKKKNSIQNELEEITYQDSKRAIRFAHVVILTLDANIAFQSQDLAIANFAVSEGRPVIIAINKWDTIKDKSRYNNALKDSIDKLLPEIKDVPLIYISAINGNNVETLLKAALESYKMWNFRVPTKKLNDWLIETVNYHPHPLNSKGKKVKIKYITQHNTRPPSFVLFSNFPEEIKDTYLRYLANSLKISFKLNGVPLRIHAKKTDNPYT